MGISDLQFDVLAELREEVAHVPRAQRRAAFLELARGVAKDFLEIAETYDVLEDDRSDSCCSEDAGSSDRQANSGTTAFLTTGREPPQEAGQALSAAFARPRKVPRHD